MDKFAPDNNICSVLNGHLSAYDLFSYGQCLTVIGLGRYPG